MMRFRILFQFFLLIGFSLTYAQQSPKLNGTIIGESISFDYDQGIQSSTVNTIGDAFDGNLDTFFASYAASNTWVGLDLGTPHVITGVSWAPRNSSDGAKATRLAVFEGANREDFLDALPLFMITQDSEVGQMNYADVTVSRAFRYVRYVSPSDAHCNIAELAFYGDELEGSDECFYQITNLPLVVIHAEGDQEPVDKVNNLPAVINVISKNGHKLLSDDGTYRLRGNYSMELPKKPYRIKFNNKHHVCGSPAKAKKWTLINNYGDKTLMRNILAFELSRRGGMTYTPFCTPVDVIVNGEYKGNYQLCDLVEVGGDRIELDEMDATCTEGDLLTGGYFIEVDAHALEEPSKFNSSRGTPVTIKSPDPDEILQVQKNYIQNSFNAMEASVFASTFADPENGYRKYLDLESFLRHFLIEEFAGNTDTYWSTFLTKPRNDDHFYVGPIWDNDIAFENDDRTYPICDLNDYVYATRGSCVGATRSFVNQIVKNDAAANARLKELWAEFRSSFSFSESSLLSFVDEQATLLDQSQRLNFERWDIMGQKVNPNLVLWGSYEAEVQNVRDYISRRIAWMDSKLGFDPASIDNSPYILNISQVGYATLFLDHPVSIPSGVDVYVGSILDDTHLQLESLDGTIPARTAVLVRGQEGEYSFDCADYVPLVSSVLEGVLEDTPVEPNTVLTLGVIDGQVGFYQYSGSVLNANRAYIPISGNSSAAIRIDDPEIITNAICDYKIDVIYDMMGHRRSSLSQGLNIWNGKTVLVK